MEPALGASAIAIVNKVGSLALEEAAGVVWPLRRPTLETAQAIQERMRAISNILRDSSAVGDGDEAVRLLIKELEGLIYDADDCLEEYSILGRRGGGWGLLWFFLGPGGPLFAFSVMKQMHGINGKLQRWLEEAPARLSHLRGAARGGGEVGVSSRPVPHLRVSDSIRRWDGRPGAAGARSVEEYQLLGMAASRERLMQWVLEGGSELSVMAVVGMKGSGKTALARAVFNDRRVADRFDYRAWVYVSESYALKDLLRAMLVQLSSERVDPLEGDELLNTVRRQLQNRRYVIVLDDVPDAGAWEAIKCAFPDGKTGSRIMMTSQSEEVASSAGKRGYVHRLGPLSPEASWELFRRFAFPSEAGDSIPKEVEAFAQKIVPRLKGLPLAILAMGSMLANTPPVQWKERLDHIDGSDMGVVIDDSDMGVVRPEDADSVLQLSYEHLDYHLQRCLLYLSIYPPDYKIRRRHLLRLWAAEGFVTERPGLTAEEVAENYLNELINRSMVQALGFDLAGRARSLRINDRIRQLIVTKSADENFVALSCEHSTAHSRKIRRLSMVDSGMYIPPKARLSRVWTLIAFDQQEPLAQLMSTSFARLRLLKVLDLEGANLWEFPADIMRLRLLKYLSLKDTHISSLPSSMKGLENLETLDLRGTQVRELPADIVCLKKLRHLLAAYCKPYTCQNLYQSPMDVKVPNGIRELTALENLSGINITNVVDDLGELTRLKTLALTGLESENAMKLCLSMDKLSCLRSLKAHSVSTQDHLDLRYINSPPILLEKLYLNGPIVELPAWIASLRKLVKIVLQRSRIGEDLVKNLQALPNLQQLDLWHDVYVGEHLYFGEEGIGGFQSLRVLNLKYMFHLEMVTIRTGTMAGLENLVIESCKKLKQMPLGLEHLTNLTELYLLGASNACIKRLRREDGEDWCRVAHIPLVRIDGE